ncbi:unnamed protein product [Rhizoctonia solani]|uniref:Uncharacterized protein n=1 Tax=Rhizoctonia solani TaxID=456999 RepID=A0A8H3E1C1_9AGAM|nr:unnamed protein product [Rhizoctonia solani]
MRFIPEFRKSRPRILNGYVLDLFLSPWTLLVKGVGLALAVGSGLSLGKEGPLVHVSCCVASIFYDLISRLKGNQAQKRRILSAAASAGVAVAFGSPLGGVLFGLEELDLFARAHVMWRAFVCAVLAAVTLQWSDVFATGNLVLFRVIGAAAMLGGVTRMTISLVVIMFELTGALSHVLPIMIAVMVSKWVGDAFGKEGIYDAWIALHGYPFLSTTVDFRDQGETAASRMLGREHIVTINAHHSTVEGLGELS